MKPLLSPKKNRVAVVLASAVLLSLTALALISISQHRTERLIEKPEPVPSLTKLYENSEYRFRLYIPENYTPLTIPSPDESGLTIVLQDESGNGIQILVSRSPISGKVLTVEDIRSGIPDMKVMDEQTIEIGEEYKGVAFKSDNEAFGGDSREVWFIFKDNLYQISTYGRFDPLLQSMFATWKFF